MIHSAFIKSEIARRYYALATGEALTRQEAINRWRMLRSPDKNILHRVRLEIDREWDKELKAS